MINTYVLEKSEKRRLGEGIIGRIFHRSLKDYDNKINIKDQLDSLVNHR